MRFLLSPTRRVMLSMGLPGIVRDLDLSARPVLMDTAAEVKPLTVAVTKMVPPCRHVSVLPETVAVEVSPVCERHVLGGEQVANMTVRVGGLHM